MSLGKDITVAVIHGIEGVATGAPGREGVTTLLRDMKQAFLKGDKDILIRNNWAATAEAQKKIMSLSWLDRQVIAFKHWIIELFSGPKLLIEKGQIKLKEGYEELVNFATKHFKGTAVAEAKVVATEIKAAAAHMDELKSILGDDVAIAKLVRDRAKGVRLTTQDPVANHVLDTLMQNIDHLDPKKLASLSHQERQELKAKVIEKALDNSKLMLRDSNGNVIRNMFVDKNDDLTKLAMLQVLEEQGHLAKLIDGNKTVKAAVEKAMGFKPDFIARTHHEFAELTEAGQQHIELEFKKAKDEIINGVKVRHPKTNKVKTKGGVAVREPGLKAQQLDVVKKAAGDEGLALTSKQLDALALKRAEYEAQVQHGLIPENHSFDDEIYNLMRDHHVKNTEVVTRKLTNSYGRQNAITSANHTQMSKELKEYGFDVPPDSLADIKTKEQFAAYIQSLRDNV